MHDIICPHCGKAFKIDESGYADILKQVHDVEFDKQLRERLELAEQDKRSAVELAQIKVTSEFQKNTAVKDAEIQKLKLTLESSEVERQLAVTQALKGVAKERDSLANELAQSKNDQKAASELGEARLASELQKAASTKDAEIQDLKAKLVAADTAHKLAITQAVNVRLLHPCDEQFLDCMTFLDGHRVDGEVTELVDLG